MVTPQSQSADAFHQMAIEQCAEALRTDLARGLAGETATERLADIGPNQLRESEGRSALAMFLGQFADLMIGLLAVAAIVSASIGEWPDAILIALIVVANAVIGFAQERRAEQAVAALKRMSRPTTTVIRDGTLAEVPASELVPGDVVELSTGTIVPADVRLISVAELTADEAALTGESLPVNKSTDPLPYETALPDRTCMAYSGTTITLGHARAVVTSTGMNSELGRIASLLKEADAGLTPLQQRLAALSRRLAVIVIGVAIVIFAAGILRESPDEWNRSLFSAMLLTSVSLAVAAIPEGLPAVITITLSLGSQRMARRQAIIRRLSAVETLGSVTVICSDKTGTLTQNRMVVSDIVPVDGDSAGHLIEAAALCNNSEPTDNGTTGTATEAAIVDVAIERGLDVAKVRADSPRLDEIAFSSDRKRMTTLHCEADGRLWLIVKGAVEQILDRCDGTASIDQWRDRANELASRGRRVLAVAWRDWGGRELPHDLPNEAESALELLGLIAIVDPVRPEARDSIEQCHSAGIRTAMITGDHPGTAQAIAGELAIHGEDEQVVTGAELDRMDDEELRNRVLNIAVYARVAPEHKLRIVRALQSYGHIVSMTGDGVNDAPALKQADIGIAMGITGTDVSREASDMILADDNFSTIVAAVEEGRVVYDNIRKFVAYLLTANTGEVLVLFLAIVFGLPLPLLPLHILWINLVTDGLPALALGFEPPEANVMRRRPRGRDDSIFADRLGHTIIGYGILMGILCLGMFRFDLPADAGEVDNDTLLRARTLVFFTLSIAQLFFVLAIRSFSQSAFRVLTRNSRLIGAVLIGALLQVAVIYIPQLQHFFHTTALSAGELAVGTVVAAVPFVVFEALKRIRTTSDLS